MFTFLRYKNQILGYDVNSVYPNEMKEQFVPTGKIKFFEGDISKIDPKAFRFFYCKISTPKYLEHPIIQTKTKTDAGFRTIAPLGEWYDYIFSEEMYNACLLGVPGGSVGDIRISI